MYPERFDCPGCQVDIFVEVNNYEKDLCTLDSPKNMTRIWCIGCGAMYRNQQSREGWIKCGQMIPKLRRLA
jgi:hypothetical protein